MPLGEIEDAIGMIESEADENADIIWGNVFREDMDDEIKVTVIATGFDVAAAASMPLPRTAAMPVAANAGGVPFIPVEPRGSEDLDVPTFIRRQAD